MILLQLQQLRCDVLAKLSSCTIICPIIVSGKKYMFAMFDQMHRWNLLRAA